MGRRSFWMLWLLAAAGAPAVGFVASGRVAATDPGTAMFLEVGSIFIALLVLGVALLTDRLVFVAARRVARRSEAVLAGQEVSAAGQARHALGEVPRMLDRLAERIAGQEVDLDTARAEARALAEAERAGLAAILRDLAEGVVRCDAQGSILLCNDAAVALLGAPPELGLHRSVFGLLDARELRHRLERHMASGALTSPWFVCPDSAGEIMLRCRLTRVEDGGFVLAIGETRLQTAALVLLDELLGGADGAAAERAAADLREAWSLQAVPLPAFAALLSERTGAAVAVAGTATIACDPYLLSMALSAILAAADGDRTTAGHMVLGCPPDGSELRCEVTGSHDLDGFRVRAAEAVIRFGSALVTPRAVLALHGGLLHAGLGGDGKAVLAIPLAVGETGPATPSVLPARPEFYDFDLPATTADAGARRLRDASFVVFDCETTGLDPLADRLVQLAAVRVLRGRILAGETFDTLVDPGIAIPPGSIRFHGITDEMVRDAPGAADAVGRFARFARDSVLVAHNAAFDMAFLYASERPAGVEFDNLVLDTLLLSALLHDHARDHSLDGLAARLGIVPQGRHSALGDSRATADILVRLLPLLEQRGIATVGVAVERSRSMLELRRARADAHAGRRPA